MARLVTRVASIALVLSLVVPATSRAVDLADGKLTVGGNASWAYVRTDKNSYLGDKDGDWSTAMFDLLAMAKPTDDVVLAAQLGFEPAGGDGETAAALEWAFGEYRVSDLLRVRAGRVKQPFGNYAELQYVGVSRPFFNLATSVYGNANVSSSSFDGVGATGEWIASSGFGVQYDVYGGALTLKAYEPWDVTPPVDPTAEPVLPEAEGENVENLAGGRISLTTPWDVTFRISGFGGKVEKDDGRLTYAVYGASIFHRGEKLWLSAEGFQSIERGFEDQISAYGEAAWFLTPKAQIAARYELTRLSLDAEGLAAEGIVSVPTSLKSHDEVAVGFNWWFTPQVVVKASVHQVWGNRFTTVSEAGAELKDKTLLFVAGTQFTF